MSKAVVPIRAANLSTRAIQTVAVGGDVLSRTNMPPAIMGGITDLFIAFDAGKKASDDDETRKIQICAEALMGFEISVVEYVLTRMRRFNPRLFPTAQVYMESACASANSGAAGCSAISSRARNGTASILSNSWKSSGARTREIDPFGPSPIVTGCWITPAMIEEFLRPAITDAYDDMCKREKSGTEIRLTEFEKISDERFNEIPEAAFDGKRDEIASLWHRRRERQAELKRQRKQLLSKFPVGAAVIDHAIGGLRGIVDEIDERNERVIVSFNHGKQAFRIWGTRFCQARACTPLITGRDPDATRMHRQRPWGGRDCRRGEGGRSSRIAGPALRRKTQPI